ncbi:DUF1642 domain-containing protein, partial [Streptococcus uberis]|nr:DUF1642 domain-containing protein [Streptococcus uberis]
MIEQIELGKMYYLPVRVTKFDHETCDEEPTVRLESLSGRHRLVDFGKNIMNELVEIDLRIDQPKLEVPQVAIDYYNEYKNVLSSFDEWFCGFYDDKFDEEFEKAEELRIWLYDNDNKINLQHELALATLIVNGPDAVTVQKEKLYTVEIPNPNNRVEHRHM